MISTSVIVPVHRGLAHLERLLPAIAAQDLDVAEVMIVETAPTTEVRELADRHGAAYESLPEDEFDHAGTRSWAARRASGEILLFLTQDVLPESSGSFGRLISKLKSDDGLAAAYGRQIPGDHASPVSRVKRVFNYPDDELFKFEQDRQRLGLRTAFVSNAFAAYRRAALAEVGFFGERLLMCEDVSAGAKLLLAGYGIHYAADAIVSHTHNHSIGEEFRRYFDIGAAHAQLDWMLERFGGPNSDGLRFLKTGSGLLSDEGHVLEVPGFIARCVLGRIAYGLGRHHHRLPEALKPRLSSFPGWWQCES